MLEETVAEIIQRIAKVRDSINVRAQQENDQHLKEASEDLDQAIAKAKGELYGDEEG